MENQQFDESDPFHVNAHLMFGFSCQTCDAELGPRNIAGADLDEGFLQYCVEISDLAKAQGWVSVETFKYLCPNCAAAHNKNLQPTATRRLS